MSSSATMHPASFRDPSGFIFERDGIIYRQVNLAFKEHYDHFITSGCYKHLVQHGLLIPHESIAQHLSGESNYYLTLRPEPIPFITYPPEWTFDMLKDAALLTLQLVRECLHYGMMLKDATPYNIQWYKGRLIFIDTLSFEKYQERPWIAYRQFCECFLGPLLLMHHSKMSLAPLQLAWPEGIPLSVTSSLLPWRTRFSLHTYLHIHLHARITGKPGKETSKEQPFSRQKLLNLLSSLETLVNGLKLPTVNSTWSGYYEEAATRADYLEQKKLILSQWIANLGSVKTAADLGANEGAFTALLAHQDIPSIAADFDPYCINRLYDSIKKTGQRNIQPMVLDLSNPTPAYGVNSEERASFLDRLEVDLVLALALIHHLAIGKNIPFTRIARLMSRVGRKLIIEYVPKQDEKVQLLLKNKADIYPDYTEQEFVQSFGEYFSILQRVEVANSGRALFLMERK